MSPVRSRDMPVRDSQPATARRTDARAPRSKTEWYEARGTGSVLTRCPTVSRSTENASNLLDVPDGAPPGSRAAELCRTGSIGEDYAETGTTARRPGPRAYGSAFAAIVRSAYGVLMDAAGIAGCARCGGPVIVADESSHPCGVYVQHGRCTACGVRLWRLLDGARVPVTGSRGRWSAASVGIGHAVSRLSHRADSATRPAVRPGQRVDRRRP
jgi:hypothetical protein